MNQTDPVLEFITVLVLNSNNNFSVFVTQNCEVSYDCMTSEGIKYMATFKEISFVVNKSVVK